MPCRCRPRPRGYTVIENSYVIARQVITQITSRESNASRIRFHGLTTISVGSGGLSTQSLPRNLV